MAIVFFQNSTHPSHFLFLALSFSSAPLTVQIVSVFISPHTPPSLLSSHSELSCVAFSARSVPLPLILSISHSHILWELGHFTFHQVQKIIYLIWHRRSTILPNATNWNNSSGEYSCCRYVWMNFNNNDCQNTNKHIGRHWIDYICPNSLNAATATNTPKWYIVFMLKFPQIRLALMDQKNGFSMHTCFYACNMHE